MTERCENCNRRMDLASPRCRQGKHPKPTMAQRIVAAIESDLNDRRGMGIDTLETDLQDSIRETWEALIEKELRL